jgi:hypothetical protein
MSITQFDCAATRTSGSTTTSAQWAPGFQPVAAPRLSLRLRRNPSATRKWAGHVVSRNRARQLDDLRDVQMLAQGVEDFVGHFDVERHLRGLPNHQLFDRTERLVCGA